MHFFADDAIFAVEAMLHPLLLDGESLVRMPGRELMSADLSQCVALLTRTVTRVDAELLAKAPELRCVASASAGFDHVDLAALERAGVSFVHAPGCNALAVAQWVIAAWTELLGQSEHGHRRDAVVGIVGHGQVGRRTAEAFRRCGHEVLVSDAPLAEAGQLDAHRSIDELLERCAVISLHVPLTEQVRHATRGLLGRPEVTAFLARGGVIINTSRGEVLELPSRIADRGFMILDVWPDEPELPWDWLVREVQAGRAWVSPHIAGYSAEAKRRGTEMAVVGLARALRRDLGALAVVPMPTPSPETPVSLADLTRLFGDHRALLKVAQGDEAKAAHAFSRLRREYAYRREFAAYGHFFASEGPLARYASLLEIE